MKKRFVVASATLAMAATAALAQAPAGSEFRVNTYTTRWQVQASVASDGSGNFVVVWANSEEVGNGYGVRGQRFNAAGVAQGSEFQINSYTTDSQGAPLVSSDPNGNFVVVWTSWGQDGSEDGVFGQRFNASGVPQGTEFQVNTYTTGSQDARFGTGLSSDADGNFVVVWQSSFGSTYGIFGQRFSADGVRQGGEFRVNTFTTGYVGRPSVGSAPNGDFVVIWQSAKDGNDYGVSGQRLNAAGVSQGSEFVVNAYTTGRQLPGAVSVDDTGNFVVAWWSYDGVFGQRFNAAGVRQGSEFQVNTYTTHNAAVPFVASDANGNFVVTWRNNAQDGSGEGIFGQRFNAAAVRQGNEFRVNSYTTNHQVLGAVAEGPDGDFVVVWTSYGQDGESSDYGNIFGQRYGDLIFEDGFDSGSLFRWSSTSTDGGDLSPSGAAAMGGTGVGLQAVVDDTNSLFVQDDTPSAESRYRVRFYVDTNGFDPGEAASHFRTRLFIANSSAFRLVTIVLKRQLGAYTIEARVRRNDGTRADTGFFPIADGPHFVEFDWQRSTGPGASNGSLQFWIDGVSVAALSGIDNDQESIELGRLGALAVKTAAGGTLFFDQFESRRVRFIGAE